MIAESIRALEISTFIPADANCMSACVYLFLGGRQRHSVGGLWAHQLRLSGSGSDPVLVDAQRALSVLLDFVRRVNALEVPDWLMDIIQTSPELTSLTTSQRLQLERAPENIEAEFDLPSITAAFNTIGHSSRLGGDATRGQGDSYPLLGNFRLGHNIVVSESAEMRLGQASDLTSSDVERLLTEGIAERFGYLSGSRLYHLGIAIDGVVCNPDGRNVAGVALSFNIWDDDLGQKIHDAPYAIRMQEPLHDLSIPYHRATCLERVIDSIESSIDLIEIILLMNPSILNVSPDTAFVRIEQLLEVNSEPSFHYALASLLSYSIEAEVFEVGQEAAVFHLMNGMRLGREIWQGLGLGVETLSQFPELTPYFLPISGEVMRRVQENLNQHLEIFMPEDGIYGNQTAIAFAHYIYGSP